MREARVEEGCGACRNGIDVGFQFAMAFQPIVDVETGAAHAYEALARGPDGVSTAGVLERITADNCYAFDQLCRVRAIEDAVAAGLLATDARLSINFMPNAVNSPLACIQRSLRTAAELGLPLERLIFEFTEQEEIKDPEHVKQIIEVYRRMGFGTAIDDFGAGYAGLSLLARFQTDYLKIDMVIVRGIDSSPPRQAIVGGIVKMAGELGITVIAEGVETAAEARTLRAAGIRYMQGFLFARPAFRALPPINWSASSFATAA